MKTRFVCGVPRCEDGYVVDAGPPITTVECDTHNSRTTHDTVEREQREQEIIRPRDAWSNWGIQGKPKR